MNVRTHDGTGTLEYDNAAYECLFTLTVSADGDVQLRCAQSPGKAVPKDWFFGNFGIPMPSPIAFNGTATDGRSVAINGRLTPWPAGWSQQNGAAAVFDLNGPSQASIGITPVDRDGEWVFGLANVNLKPLSHDDLTLQLGTTTALFRALRDGSAILRPRPKHIVVTTEVCLPGDLVFDEAKTIASHICSILSLSSGTLVSWIYADKRSPSRETFSFYHPAITRPYNGSLPLIDPNEPQETLRFLQDVFNIFNARWKERGLSVLARAIADIRTTGFVDTRALQVVSLVEYIVSTDSQIADSEFIIERKTFEKGRERIVSLVRQAIQATFPEADTSQVNQMCSHIEGWNRLSFRRQLSAVATRLGANIFEDEIKAFHRTRNALVHHAAFITEEPFKEFQLMLSVLDRLVMALLEYSGPYIDAQTFKRAV